jgi:serine/threonine protein kinase
MPFCAWQEKKVKILDFGLAKAFQEESAAADLSQSPTLTAAMTRAGVILGTASYMSPEQARGKAVDKRTDIWAFGCVLYEALTGRKAFDGETVTDILGAVVKSEPDYEVLPAESYPVILRLLQRCLQKDSNNRLRDLGDARIETSEAIQYLSGTQPTATTAAEKHESANFRQAPINRFLIGILLVFAIPLSILIWKWPGRSSTNLSDRAVSRFYIETPSDKQLWAQGDELALALSADGQLISVTGYSTPELPVRPRAARA